MHEKIRKADAGMVVPTFNGSPLSTWLNSDDWSNTIQSGLNTDLSSKIKFKGYEEPKRYTLLPDLNWYDKYLTQLRKTLFPNSQLMKKVNNPFNVSLTYTPPDVLKEYSQNLFKNPFEEINSPLHMGSLLRLTGNKDLQEYGNELWERGLKLTNFNAPSVDDLAKYASKTFRTTHFTSEKEGSLLNETPVDKKFNTDELNNAYSSLGEYGDAAIRLGHSLGVGIGGEWGDAVSKAATGALVTTNAIKNLKKLKGVKGQNVAKAGNIAAITGAVSDVASSFLPEKTEYAGDKGNVTETIDTIYDGVSDAAMAFGPVGMLVGGIMKGGKLLGGVMNSVGGGTDGMTTADAILGSSFLNLTPIGLINGFGGLKAETITKNELAFEQVGSSYTGTGRAVDDALKKSGKKYGLFSSGARKLANEEILEALRQQNILTDIADYATDRFDIRNSMAAINGNKRRFLMLGGYNQSAISVGRNGMVIKDLQRAKRITSSMKYQKGGKVADPYQSYLLTLPEYQRDDSNFRVRDYWEFNGRPKDFNEAISKGMFTQFEDGWHANSVAKNPKTGEIEFMKSSSHPSILKELDWYESDDATEFRNLYELLKTEPYFKYIKRKNTDLPQSFKEGGNLTNLLVELDFNSISDEFRGIDEVNLDSILPEFKEGGSLKPENSPSSNKESSYEWTIDYVKSKDLDWVKRWLDPNRATIPDWEMEGRAATHKLSRDSGDFDGKTMYVVYPKVLSINGLLYDFTDPKNKRGKFDAYDSAINNHEAVLFEDEGAADWFIDHYKEYAPAFDKYREGGKFNVIPEGALHARKHNIDVEGITKKGIPVVSESPDGKLEQQAEIEREEIIFRLEVTKKLEELAKDGSDEAAIEAGKLLVKEILYNTVDNTNSLI